MNINEEFETVTKANAGVEIELVSIKTGKGSGCFVKVHGMDSEAFDAATAERARILADKAESGNEITPKDRAEAQSALLGACTISWRCPNGTFLEIDGAEWDCSHEAAMKLYMRFPAIREQINRAVGDRANFVGA